MEIPRNLASSFSVSVKEDAELSNIIGFLWITVEFGTLFELTSTSTWHVGSLA
jgi:hypothetical protein